MDLAALAFFMVAISAQDLGWQEKQHVLVLGNDELPGLSAKPPKPRATVR